MLGARRVVVTGANKGIGLALVRALVAEGSTDVIMTFRKGNNGPEIYEQIRKECPNALLHYYLLDITDEASRFQFVNHMEKDFGQIDVLVNNAALGYDEPDKVPEKVLAESYLKCNFLATMAFTELLLPLLSSDGKVINVSSRVGALSNHSEVVHSDMQEVQQMLRNDKITKEELIGYANDYVDNCEKGDVKGWCLSAYRTSKTLLNSWSRFVLMYPQNKFSRLLKEKQSVLVLTPGFCATDMVIKHHNPLVATNAPQPKSAEEGIKTILYCIFELPYDNSHSGQFFAQCKQWNYETD